MTKNKIYRYFGRNGIITTPILIDGATAVTMYRLIADPGKELTNGEIKSHMVDVFEDEIANWAEIDKAETK